MSSADSGITSLLLPYIYTMSTDVVITRQPILPN